MPVTKTECLPLFIRGLSRQAETPDMTQKAHMSNGFGSADSGSLHSQLRRAHDEWIQRTWTTDFSAVEHQLVSTGVDRRIAAIAADSVITPTSS